MEKLYKKHLSQYPEMAHTIARHYDLANIPQKAVYYFKLAGANAVRLTAHQDAVHHFYHALKILRELPQSEERDLLELDLQLSLGPPLTALKGWGASELETAYDRAQELCEHIEDADRLFPALFLLATFRLGRSEHAKVDRLVNRLIKLAQQINDPELLAIADLQVSPVFQGRFTQARTLLERTVASQDIDLQRHLAQRFGMSPKAMGLCFLSNCLWILGFPEQADQVDKQAFEVAERIDHPMTTCYVTGRSCWMGMMKSDPDHVWVHQKELYRVAHKHGFRNFELAAKFFENWYRFEKGLNPQQAIEGMQKNLEAYYATKTILNRTAFLVFLSEACLQKGQRERGLKAIQESIDLGDKTGERWFQAEAWRIKGELILFSENGMEPGARQKAEALVCFQEALVIAETQNAKMWALKIAMSLAKFYAVEAKWAEGIKILEKVYGSFTEGFDTRCLRQAGQLLESLKEEI